MREAIVKNVKRRMTPQPLKIRADVELTCFAYDGVLFIQARRCMHPYCCAANNAGNWPAPGGEPRSCMGMHLQRELSLPLCSMHGVVQSHGVCDQQSCQAAKLGAIWFCRRPCGQQRRSAQRSAP